MFFPKKFFPNLYRSHHLFSCLYKNTAFGPFRRPDKISESRNSSPLSKSIAPIRLNLVPPKPDCPPYQQTEHIPSISDGILVQLQTKTSRERPKSAPYLRLNKTRKPLFLQLETAIFFDFIFEVSGKSHSTEKCKRGTLWDFLNIHSVAKYQKIDGGAIKKFRKK